MILLSVRYILWAVFRMHGLGPRALREQAHTRLGFAFGLPICTSVHDWNNHCVHCPTIVLFHGIIEAFVLAALASASPTLAVVILMRQPPLSSPSAPTPSSTALRVYPVPNTTLSWLLLNLLLPPQITSNSRT